MNYSLATSPSVWKAQTSLADDPRSVEFLCRHYLGVLLHANIIAAAWRLFRVVNARRAVDLMITDNLANIGCAQNKSVRTGWSPKRCHGHTNQTGDVE